MVVGQAKEAFVAAPTTRGNVVLRCLRAKVWKNCTSKLKGGRHRC